MDERSRPLNFPLLFVIAVAMALTFILARYFAARKGRYLAHVEYWVLSPGTKLPDLTETMAAVMQHPSITPSEGLLFSDVRFKIGLILAEKNKNAELLTRLDYRDAFARAGSAIRVQYTSETKLDNLKHLRLCMHVASAIAKQVGALSILDVVADRLWTVREFEGTLVSAGQSSAIETHVKIIEQDDCSFKVNGLQKVGVPDLHTLPVERDKLLIARRILDQYAEKSWEAMTPNSEPIEEYGDQFLLLRVPTKPGIESARLLRRQAK